MILLSVSLTLWLSSEIAAIDPHIVAGFNSLGFKQVIKGLPRFEVQGNVEQADGINGKAISLEQKGDYKTDAACIAAPVVKQICPFVFDQCKNGVTVAMWVFFRPLEGECGTLFSLGDGHVFITPGTGNAKVLLNIALNDQMTSCFCSEEEWDSMFLGKWIHMTFVTNPGPKDNPVKMYINGELYPLDPSKCYQLKHYPLADLPNMFIGCQSNAFSGSDRGVCGFNGMIDDFQVFVGQLDGAQVQALAAEDRPDQNAT